MRLARRCCCAMGCCFSQQVRVVIVAPDALLGREHAQQWVGVETGDDMGADGQTWKTGASPLPAALQGGAKRRVLHL